MLGLLALSAVFVAGGLWMSSEKPMMGYLCAGFFGLCLVVFTLQLLPNSSYLRLDPEGFTMRGLFRGNTVRWADVERFSVICLHNNDMVAWDYAPHYKTQSLGRAVSRGLVGIEAALPDTYGMKAEQLAVLMNRLRLRYGSKAAV
jgi:hypothetical protein